MKSEGFSQLVNSSIRILFVCSRVLKRSLRKLWSSKLLILYAFTSLLSILHTHHKLTALEPIKHDEMAWRVGGLFVFMTVPLSLHLCYQHLSTFVNPRQQSQTVRIICTIPVYCFSAWLCLLYPTRAMYIHGVRELYEAYGK
jgi:hypothetical protein